MWGQSSIGICAFLLYMKPIQCSGVPEMYGQYGGVGYVWP